MDSIARVKFSIDRQDLKEIHVEGWGNGNYVIQTVRGSTDIEIHAPRNLGGLGQNEYWTFDTTRKRGVLFVQSSLYKNPGLIKRRPKSGLPLIIQLPVQLAKKIVVVVEQSS